MYVVVAHIVATYSGQSYMSFVQDRIFDPLNMTSSGHLYSEALKRGGVSQAWARGRRVPMPTDDTEVEVNAGPGGILSNVVDLVSFLLSFFEPLKAKANGTIG
jgi:CubicO group peptidase (beta-lactamase class C family)